MNEIANLCEKVGADAEMVRVGISTDSRIGNKFLFPGLGYGGSCFPKDVKALIHTAKDNGYTMQLLEAVEAVNEHQKTVLFEKICRHYECSRHFERSEKSLLENRTIAIWGLAFKPNTDDIREATSIVLIKQLLVAGAKVRVFDPVVKSFPTFLGFDNAVSDGSIYFAKDAYDATYEADLLCLVTEWQEFRLPNWQIIKKSLKEPVIIDGRNIYDPTELKKLGFEYRGIGI